MIQATILITSHVTPNPNVLEKNSKSQPGQSLYAHMQHTLIPHTLIPSTTKIITRNTKTKFLNEPPERAGYCGNKTDTTGLSDKIDIHFISNGDDCLTS
ncbi:hypothetical protein PRUPE_3G172500 [Prunus persica]|uniref:Uncharacterized protein n=1 Tax=Prunus persica TaxID=3760 RepID=A0A251Q1G3_PRUPE|nr:hypothetical protein PRUPE_3G172500 [Prunus persica]